MEIIKIIEAEYNILDIPTLFNPSRSDKCLAVIKNRGNLIYKLAWQSDLIEPDVKKIKNSIYSIGIDENFCIFNAKEIRIELSILLFYPFITSFIQFDSILVATEREVLKIETNNFSIAEKLDLPDIFKDICIYDKQIIITCMDNSTLILN